MRGLLIALALTTIPAWASAQTTLVLNTDAQVSDFTIRGGTHQDTNFSTGWLETAAGATAEDTRRALLKFDTATPIPLGSRVWSATLRLTVRSGLGLDARPIDVRRVSTFFLAESATWARRRTEYLWLTAGGDYDARYGSASVPGSAGATIAIDVTALVQENVNGVHGSRYTRLALLDAGPADSSSLREYYSTESADPALRPRLEVVYGGNPPTAAPPPPPPSVLPGPGDIVLHPGAPGTTFAGQWQRTADASAASGARAWQPNLGQPKVVTALANPANYFEMTFDAQAGVGYQLWMRLRAQNDSWANDSVHIQFSGAVTLSGTPTFRIGTTSSTTINLEDCGGVCPKPSAWGWQDTGYGAGVFGEPVYFAQSGPQTIRVQTREDGASIDQILLSPAKFTTTAPGSLTGDGTIYPITLGPPPPATLKVLHWNIHHGFDVTKTSNLERVSTLIAQVGAELVSINEAEQHTGWGDQDQPAILEALLEQKTGKEWYRFFAQCYAQWGSNGGGNLILSRFPFVSSSGLDMTLDRSAAQATVVVEGRTLTFFSTHLDNKDASLRATQLGELLAYAAGFALPRIIAGDLNAVPGPELAPITAGYVDAWSAAVAAGTATTFPANPNGYTFGLTKRIDYSFSAGSVVVKKVDVLDTRDAAGMFASDHNPIVVVYEIR